MYDREDVYTTNVVRLDHGLLLHCTGIWRELAGGTSIGIGLDRNLRNLLPRSSSLS